MGAALQADGETRSALSGLKHQKEKRSLGADSEEKHEPASDIDTVVVDSLKALDPKRPIREADMAEVRTNGTAHLLTTLLLTAQHIGKPFAR